MKNGERLYNPKEIEPKWQKYWEENKSFEASNDFSKHVVESFIRVNQTAAKLFRKAENYEAFVKSVLNCPELKLTYGFAELAKEDRDYFYHIRGILGDSCKKAYSEAGSLKIGTSNCSFLVGNGYGDGTFRPDNFIGRAEAVVMVNNILDRHYSLEVGRTGENTYTDTLEDIFLLSHFQTEHQPQFLHFLQIAL